MSGVDLELSIYTGALLFQQAAFLLSVAASFRTSDRALENSQGDVHEQVAIFLGAVEKLGQTLGLLKKNQL